MSERRKPPRWAGVYLRALERTGKAREAAADAGIDHTTAYQRRRTNADFAQAWEEALAAHRRRVEENPSTIESSSNGPPPHAAPREELVGAGGQMKRAGNGRWSQAREKVFFDELAATANVRRAAQAAGISTNAVYARRMKHPLFRAKWEAVVETAKASIDMYVVEAAKKTFDPDELDTGDVTPKVTVAEALKIVQLHGSKAQRDTTQRLWAEQPAGMGEEEVTALRERLIAKFQRLRERDWRERLEAGWRLDEEHDSLVPPGWEKAAG